MRTATETSCASEALYYGIEPQTASSQTGYKWSFASKTSKADNDALRAAREEVGVATYQRSRSSGMPQASGSGRVQGPTLPKPSDLVIAREDAEDQRMSERDMKRKRSKKEQKERLEDVVGPKEVGKEAMLEKKRATREADRAFRERGDDGLEADESTLMGGGDSFRDRYVLHMHDSLCILINVHRCSGLLKGMLLVRGSRRRNSEPERTVTLRFESVLKLFVRRRKRRWICSCRWRKRNTADHFLLVSLFQSPLGTIDACNIHTNHAYILS